MYAKNKKRTIGRLPDILRQGTAQGNPLAVSSIDLDNSHPMAALKARVAPAEAPNAEESPPPALL
ncbi:MAG: hypothetical protein AB7H71_17870 [Alphaproteobacteria bacterium]